jgi:tetratricopeptide (TPR) repeat protein
MNQGRQAVLNRDFQAAIDAFMKVIAIEPNNVKALYNLGYSYRQTGDKDKAIEFSERAVQADPDQLYVHQNLGFAYEDADQMDKAMSEFEEELRRHPEDPNLAGIAAKLAQIYLDRDLLEEAFDAASRAVRLRPENPANHYVLARVHMRNKAYDQAIVSLEKALQLAPDSAYYRIHLGDALWEAGRKDEARKYYNEAIDIDPGVADQIDRSRLTQ